MYVGDEEGSAVIRALLIVKSGGAVIVGTEGSVVGVVKVSDVVIPLTITVEAPDRDMVVPRSLIEEPGVSSWLSM